MPIDGFPDGDRRQRRVRSSLGLSVADAILHAVMLGVSESYLGALAVELGHRDRSLALLTTVPLVAGAVSQMGAGFLVDRLGSRKRAVVLGAALQALSLLGFVWIATADERSLGSLMTAKICWWVSGSIIAPPWGAWMASLTERVPRERYFAWRSGTAQAALWCAVIVGGHVLQGAESGELLDRYAKLFWIGALARGLSAFALAAKVELEPRAPRAQRGRSMLAIRTAKWKVPLYMAGLMFGAHIAVPFFTPYMLRDLGLDYASFAVLNSLSIASKALVFPLCHRLAGRFGLARVLWLGGTGVGVVPLVWYLSDSMASLTVVQVLGGASWAALEYASFQILLQSSSSECRVEFLAIHGMLSGVGQLAGAMVGSFLIEALGASYREVFLCSSLLRIAPLLLMIPVVRRIGFQSFTLVTSMVSIRPVAGAVRRLIVGTDTEPPEH